MIEIRPLRPMDDRTRFQSGNPDLDRFFKLYAGQNQFRHHVGTTYVAVEDQEIKGYATISASHIEIEFLKEPQKKKLPQYPLPVLRLARLAISEHSQGQGIGLQLLKTVFDLAKEMRQKFGCVGIVVDAKPEAVEFYSRYGFERIDVKQGKLADRPEPIQMFLALKSIP
ncbi:MAG: GNAT family N-acetyltransferase [SAR324 cluster bacterium]|nr:GNAT family N-acetyltransferase [SAR324 cluster bacterium]MBF0350067.1 GNAT family N-acetyltransferase [SAR324 cluster bacterium]